MLQEPDSYGLMWERTNNGWPALQDLYLGVLDGVWAIGKTNPAAQSILFVIQVCAGDWVCAWHTAAVLHMSRLLWRGTPCPQVGHPVYVSCVPSGHLARPLCETCV